MDTALPITNLNDWIFCPRSIFWHTLYGKYHAWHYKSTDQTKGSNAHKRIDSHSYSSRKDVLQGIDVRSNVYWLVGKIDLYHTTKYSLIERKKKIKKIYAGYILQVHAQALCLEEMGYPVHKIQLYSMDDNKTYLIHLPTDEDKRNIQHLITDIRTYNIISDTRDVSPNKCAKCIYRELCDRSHYNTDTNQRQ